MFQNTKTTNKLTALLLVFVMLLSLVPVASLTAYADNTETLLTTITATGDKQASYSTANVANVSFSTTAGGSSAYLANWGWWGYGWSATVNAAEGYTITKCVFYDDANRTATDSSSPFVVETTEEDKTPRINGTPIDGGNYQSKGIKKIEVYGYATPALDPVSYMAWNGTTLVEKTGDDACTDYTVVTADTTTFEDGKWYVVSNSVTVSSRITVTGTANLILRDGATLTAGKGITVNSGNTINIYAQIGGTGELNAGSDISVASIGGGARYQSGGTVNIHGGKITATGGANASGIGGALDGGNGEVNIYSGEVTARGQNYAAGIGGYSGKSGGTVNIYGGTVNASGSQYGTTGIGIGGIKPGSCVVHIYGGEVTATSEKAAAGIQGTVTIDGGTVTANGGVSVGIDGSSGETYSSNGINGTVAINGGTVTATGGNVTASDYMGAIECSGGTIYACSGISGTVTISGGTVTATGGNVTGDINNSGGTIYACNGVNGTVTISGGTVTATGGSHTGSLNNYRGTTVKEKGFGGSLTLGTGMYLYGGTSANPESDLSNYRAGAGDYTGDRYVYMTVNNVVPHIHSFTYTATGATITAACTAGCDITEGLALTISAPTELTYDGSAKAATLSTGYNTTAFPGEYMIKYYKGANEVEAANVKAAGDYTAKVTVGEATASVDFTIAKATPSIETIPTASAVTYGQKLADSTLTNGVAKLGDNTVEGTFAWKNTETKPSVSDSNITEYAVMFNPTDTDNYAAVECKVKLTVNRAEPTVTVPTAKAPTYNGSAQELVNAGSATGGTMYYAVTTENMAPTDENLYTTYIPTATNAGIYYVWYKIAGDENHNDTEPACEEVTINKADPTYTVPTDLNATYGDTLVDVALPTGWAWADNTANVGNAGTNTFKANFTPADTANYNTVNNVDVTVTVVKADPTYTVPTGLTATYGQTLANVTLPTGWAWVDSTQSVGNIGTNTFKANFTPADTANYNTVSGVDVNVTVGKTAGKDATISTDTMTYNSDSIYIEGVAGQEYVIVPKGTAVTDADWNTSVKPDPERDNWVFFENLKEATEYEIYARTAETETAFASDAVKANVYTTLSSIGYLYDSTLVGASITVEPEPNVEGLTYKWYQDEVTEDDDGIIHHNLTEIPGATGSTYTFRAEDAGKNIAGKIFAGDSEVGDFATDAPVALTAKVIFESSGGSDVETLTGAAYQSKIKAPADPTREGFAFDGWYWDEEFETPFDFEKDVITWTETTLYAKWTPNDYKITSVTGLTGANNKQWTKGGKDAVVITVKVSGEDNSFDHFTGVELDGKELVKDVDYTVEKGSTVVTLKPETLEKLSVGEHTVTVLFDNGEVNTDLTVKAANSGSATSPQTGDNSHMGLWIVLMILSLCGLAATFFIGKKKRIFGR